MSGGSVWYSEDQEILINANAALIAANKALSEANEIAIVSQAQATSDALAAHEAAQNLINATKADQANVDAADTALAALIALNASQADVDAANAVQDALIADTVTPADLAAAQATQDALIALNATQAAVDAANTAQDALIAASASQADLDAEIAATNVDIAGLNAALVSVNDALTLNEDHRNDDDVHTTVLRKAANDAHLIERGNRHNPDPGAPGVNENHAPVINAGGVYQLQEIADKPYVDRRLSLFDSLGWIKNGGDFRNIGNTQQVEHDALTLTRMTATGDVETFSYPATSPIEFLVYWSQGRLLIGDDGANLSNTVNRAREEYGWDDNGTLRGHSSSDAGNWRFYINPFTGDVAGLIPQNEETSSNNAFYRYADEDVTLPAELDDYVYLGFITVRESSNTVAYSVGTGKFNDISSGTSPAKDVFFTYAANEAAANALTAAEIPDLGVVGYGTGSSYTEYRILTLGVDFPTSTKEKIWPPVTEPELWTQGETFVDQSARRITIPTGWHDAGNSEPDNASWWIQPKAGAGFPLLAPDVSTVALLQAAVGGDWELITPEDLQWKIQNDSGASYYYTGTPGSGNPAGEGIEAVVGGNQILSSEANGRTRLRSYGQALSIIANHDPGSNNLIQLLTTNAASGNTAPLQFRTGNASAGNSGDMVFTPGQSIGGSKGRVIIRRNNAAATDKNAEFWLEDGGFRGVGFKAPDPIAETTIWELPDKDGNPGQALTTDGNKKLTFQDSSAGGSVDLRTLVIDRTSAQSGTNLNNRFLPYLSGYSRSAVVAQFERVELEFYNMKQTGNNNRNDFPIYSFPVEALNGDPAGDGLLRIENYTHFILSTEGQRTQTGIRFTVTGNDGVWGFRMWGVKAAQSGLVGVDFDNTSTVITEIDDDIWMRGSLTINGAADITFPKNFASTNYHLSLTSRQPVGSGFRILNKQVNFANVLTLESDGTSASGTVDWMAWGKRA